VCYSAVGMCNIFKIPEHVQSLTELLAVTFRIEVRHIGSKSAIHSSFRQRLREVLAFSYHIMKENLSSNVLSSPDLHVASSYSSKSRFTGGYTCQPIQNTPKVSSKSRLLSLSLSLNLCIEIISRLGISRPRYQT